MTEWKSSCFISFYCHGIDSTTTTKCGIHRLQEFFSSVEKTDSCIRHHLVSRSHEEINSVFLHVGLHMRKALRTVEDKESFILNFEF